MHFSDYGVSHAPVMRVPHLSSSHDGFDVMLGMGGGGSIALSNSACAALRARDFGKSVRLYRELIDMRLKLKSGDVDLAVGVCGAADALLGLRRLDEAEHVVNQGKKMREALHGRGRGRHPDVDACYEILEEIRQARDNGEDKSDPSERGKRRCGALGCSSVASLRCTTCKDEVYCSRDCQRVSWRRHKHECIPPAEAAPEAAGGAGSASASATSAGGTAATAAATAETGATKKKLSGRARARRKRAARRAAGGTGGGDGGGSGGGAGSGGGGGGGDAVAAPTPRADETTVTAEAGGARGDRDDGAADAESAGAAPRAASADATADSLEAARREIEELRKRSECPVCLEDHGTRVALVPCGHELCEACADSVMGTGAGEAGSAREAEPQCPMCRKHVDSVLRLFR